MKDNKNENALLERARQLCSSREYCKSEISAILERWGERDETVKGRIINKLISDRFIDEKRYSRAFALDHFRYQRWGRVKIAAALKLRKIQAEIISSALNEIEEDEYRRSLKDIIEAYRRTVKAKNRYDLKGKLHRHALSKGFESHLIFEILGSSFDD